MKEKPCCAGFPLHTQPYKLVRFLTTNSNTKNNTNSWKNIQNAENKNNSVQKCKYVRTKNEI